jgi:hypothetical protein
MPAFDPQLVFAVLGPLFLALGGWRVLHAGALVPQARTWLIIGVLFCAVAAWLWSH